MADQKFESPKCVDAKFHVKMQALVQESGALQRVLPFVTIIREWKWLRDITNGLDNDGHAERLLREHGPRLLQLSGQYSNSIQQRWFLWRRKARSLPFWKSAGCNGMSALKRKSQIQYKQRAMANGSLGQEELTHSGYSRMDDQVGGTCQTVQRQT